MKMKYTKIFVIVAVFLFAVPLILKVTPADAKSGRKVIKLRCIAGHPDTASPWVRLIKSYFVPEVEKRVLEQTKDYEVKIQNNYGGSVAALGECLEAIQSGIGDMGNVVWVFEMSKLYPHNMNLWFPCGPADLDLIVEATHKTFEKFPFLDEMLENYNQKRLAFGILGSYEIVSNFPIETLEDMKGHKVAHGGPMVPWIEALGAVGVQSRLNEAYTSMQTGVYDGWFMEPNYVVGFRMYEPSPYYTLAGLGGGITQLLTINLDKWNALPKEIQDIISEVGRDVEYLCTQDAENMYYKQIVYMATQGVTVRKLSKKERGRFAKAMDDAQVADKMAKECDKLGYPGSEMARYYVKTLSDMGYEWPFVPTIK